MLTQRGGVVLPGDHPQRAQDGHGGAAVVSDRHWLRNWGYLEQHDLFLKAHELRRRQGGIVQPHVDALPPDGVAHQEAIL